MRRGLTVISCGVALALSAPFALARVNAEDGPVANLTNGQVVEVPEVAQPGSTSTAAAMQPTSLPPTTVKKAGTAPAPVNTAADAERSRRASASEGKSLGAAPTGSKKATGTAADSASKADRTGGAKDASWSDHWLVRTAGALIILGGLLWCVRLFMVRLASGGGMGFAAQFGAGGRSPAGLMEVLGRYPVSRGHTLVLLKLDRRVLLLGQSAAGFTTLTELTDAEDVASILTKAADTDGKTMTRRFGELLRGMERDASLIDEESGRGELTASPISPRAAMRLAGGNGGAA